MLVFEVRINYQEIDKIGIWNIGEDSHKVDGYYKYKVLKMNDSGKWVDRTDRIFVHERLRGWMPLVKQVLDHLIIIEDTDHEYG